MDEKAEAKQKFALDKYHHGLLFCRQSFTEQSNQLSSTTRIVQSLQKLRLINETLHWTMDQLRFCQWKETLRCFAESVMDDVLSGFNLEYNLEAEPARWSVKNLCIRNGASVISGIRKTEMFYASFSECLVCKVYLKEAVCVSHETNAPGRWCCIMLSSASKSGGSRISQTGAPTPLVGVPTYNFCHFPTNCMKLNTIGLWGAHISGIPLVTVNSI